MNLTLVGWTREVSSEEPKQWSLYSVSGLPESQKCIIGDAGLDLEGTRNWYAHIYETGELITDLGPYGSPQDALLAVEATLSDLMSRED
jgi:hypothetical protein